eukprot:COSAG06_NODE_186_length_20792_cov_1041.487443_26_plen_57_part_00
MISFQDRPGSHTHTRKVDNPQTVDVICLQGGEDLGLLRVDFGQPDLLLRRARVRAY